MKYECNPAVLSRKEEGEKWCLYNPQTSSIHFVGEFAWWMWKLLEKPADLDELMQRLSTYFDLAPDDVQWRELVESGLSRLFARELIREAKL